MYTVDSTFLELISQALIPTDSVTLFALQTIKNIEFSCRNKRDSEQTNRKKGGRKEKRTAERKKGGNKYQKVEEINIKRWK